MGFLKISCLFVLCVECNNRRHSYLPRIRRLSGVCYYVLQVFVLNLDVQTIVHRVYQLTWALPLREPAETVECASRTVEDSGREHYLWSGCESKPVSADQMHSTRTAQSPQAHKTASSIVCGSWVDMIAGISTRS